MLLCNFHLCNNYLLNALGIPLWPGFMKLLFPVPPPPPAEGPVRGEGQLHTLSLAATSDGSGAAMTLSLQVPLLWWILTTLFRELPLDIGHGCPSCARIASWQQIQHRAFRQQVGNNGARGSVFRSLHGSQCEPEMSRHQCWPLFLSYV